MHHFNRVKSSLKILATSLTFKKLPSVNNRPIDEKCPMGEKPPNLVTLLPKLVSISI
jgi:hypothetical protein